MNNSRIIMLIAASGAACSHTRANQHYRYRQIGSDTHPTNNNPITHTTVTLTHTHKHHCQSIFSA